MTPNMKTKLVLLLVFATLTVSAQTNSIHNWTLKSGAVFPGDYFSAGTQMVVIKSHGTNCLLKISELSTNDWLYFYQCKMNQRQMQLDAEAAQMRTAGKMEFAIKQIKNFPEKVVGRYGWIDAYFDDLDPYGVESKEDELGFYIRDENREYFSCRAVKTNPYNGQTNPLISEITNLKRGDKVRFIAMGMPDVKNNNMNKLTGIYVSKIEMIESVADAATVKKDLETPGGVDPNTGLPK